LDCIRTYRKDRIARWGDYSRLRMSSKNYFRSPNRTTLQRSSLTTIFAEGV
jgi:hypothetical protein